MHNKMGQDVKVIEKVSELGSKEEKDFKEGRKERKKDGRKERKKEEGGREGRKEEGGEERDGETSCLCETQTSHSLHKGARKCFLSVVLVILEKLLKLVFCISFLKCLQN